MNSSFILFCFKFYKYFVLSVIIINIIIFSNIGIVCTLISLISWALYLYNYLSFMGYIELPFEDVKFVGVRIAQIFILILIKRVDLIFYIIIMLIFDISLYVYINLLDKDYLIVKKTEEIKSLAKRREL